MWARLDDELIDHFKIFTAGKLIGRNGPVIALGFYALGLLWANRHLSDGHLPAEIVAAFPHAAQPARVAEALVQAGLWERNGNGGYQIHDFTEFGNPTAARVKAKRDREKRRKRREREAKEDAHKSLLD